jgi:hypothetical protein
MKRFALLASLSVVALAGCGHTVYRDTVVEKQPIVHETVIERPVTASPTLVPSAPSTLVAVPTTTPAPGSACGLGSQAYAHGTMSCLSGNQYQCIDGVWKPLAGAPC